MPSALTPAPPDADTPCSAGPWTSTRIGWVGDREYWAYGGDFGDEPRMSVGMLGCDFKCPFCQNWEISQTLRDPETDARAGPRTASPEGIVAAALAAVWSLGRRLLTVSALSDTSLGLAIAVNYLLIAGPGMGEVERAVPTIAALALWRRQAHGHTSCRDAGGR